MKLALLVAPLFLLIAPGLYAADGGEPDPARLQALAALGAKGDDASRKTLIEILQNAQALPWERESAIKALAQTKAGGMALLQLAEDEKIADEYKATVSFAAAGSPDADVRKKGEDVAPVSRTKDDKPLLPAAQMVQLKGDAANGAKIFRDAKGANCISCHQMGNEGKLIGPPLTTIGEKLPKDQLFESVLTPSASILMGYENWVVKTKGGQIVTGILSENTDDHITIMDNQGTFIDIPAGDVEKRTKQALSMMPEGLVKTMTLQELVDLVEFLSKQKY